MKRKGFILNSRRSEARLPELEQLLIDAASARLEGSRESLRRRRRPGTSRVRIAAVGVLAVAAAGLVIAVGSGGKSGVRPEVASAAVELTQLGDTIPRIRLAGVWPGGWQIVSTESTPDDGSIQYRYEGPLASFRAVPASRSSEIRWHTGTLGDRADELESEGFTFAREQRMQIQVMENHGAGPFTEMPAQVYVSNKEADGSFDAVGLWEEGGRTLEYRVHVLDFYDLELLMERFEVLTKQNWLVALQPGGARWLNHSVGGLLQKVEKVKVGEKPNGDPIYSETAIVGDVGAEGQQKTLEDGFPTIIHEGDTVRTEVAEPPTSLSTH